MGSAGYIGKSVSLCTVFEYLGGHGTSLELMAYAHWPQPRPEEGPGTNGLYKTVPKLLHCTWHWTGAQTYCSPLFCLQSPFLSRSQFHSVWIHHYSSDNCDKVKHRLKNVAYILNECSRNVEESTCCVHAYHILKISGCHTKCHTSPFYCWCTNVDVRHKGLPRLQEWGLSVYAWWSGKGIHCAARYSKCMTALLEFFWDVMACFTFGLRICTFLILLFRHLLRN